jgi:molybdopterin molybdotransferase
MFLVPMLERLLGLTGEHRALTEAVLGAALPENGTREHYMRAKSEWREDGVRVVTALPSQDSSLVAALAQADCLIVRAPDAAALPEGARVRIMPLDRD